MNKYCIEENEFDDFGGFVKAGKLTQIYTGSQIKSGRLNSDRYRSIDEITYL